MCVCVCVCVCGAGLPPIYAAGVPLLVYTVFGTSRQLAIGTYSLTHSRTHALTFTHSLTHSLTHSPMILSGL
jgi:hypothetical protein